MKHKILFIMHVPPPIHGASIVGKYIHDSELIHSNYDCYYLKPSDTKSLDDLKKLKFSKITFFISFHIQLIKTYRKIKPDLCYFTSSSWSLAFYRDFITVVILKLLKANIVLHFHNKGAPSFINKWYHRYLYRLFFKGVSVIFLAESLAKDFQKYIDDKKIFICPNGISSTILNPIERTHTHMPFTFLFLSNMMEKKGVWILLQACLLIKSKGYSFCCNYVGQWSDITETAFTEKVLAYGLTDNVKAYGAKYGADKKVYFRSADAFVFPSFDEAMGLVLIEAMEASLPCISTYEGGIPSVIKDGHSGFLVEPKNIDELAEKMIYYMEHPRESIEMGKFGRALFEEKYTLQKFEQKFSGIMQQVICHQND